MHCVFCNKEVEGEISKKQHEIRCKKNPNKINVKPSYGMLGKKGANQYTYGAEVKESTRKKLSDAGKKQIWTEERKEKHSIAMKQAVKNNPEAYTSSNRGRTKQIIYNGIKFHGGWELEFYQYCEKNNISVERNFESFEYEWNGIRSYFPDFYLSDFDLYVEIKGYKTDRDVAKWKNFPKKLKIIMKKEILDIRKGFDIIF